MKDERIHYAHLGIIMFIWTFAAVIMICIKGGSLSVFFCGVMLGQEIMRARINGIRS